MTASRRPELDRFLPECQEKAAKGLCEGSCEEHRGPSFAVRVLAEGADWGWFSYCQEALEEDARRGMTFEFADRRDSERP